MFRHKDDDIKYIFDMNDSQIRKIMEDGCLDCKLPWVWRGGIPFCPRCLKSPPPAEPAIDDEDITPDDSCTGCQHAVPGVSDDGDDVIFKCRRYPPQLFVLDGYLTQSSPDANERCGEYTEGWNEP